MGKLPEGGMAWGGFLMVPICCNKSRLIGHLLWGCECLSVAVPRVTSATNPLGQEVPALPGDQRGLRADQVLNIPPESLAAFGPSFPWVLEVGRESQGSGRMKQKGERLKEGQLLTLIQ